MKPNKAFTLFARITLVCLTLFVVGAALSTGSSGVDVVGVLTVAAAPFAFVLPDALKSQMTKEEQEAVDSMRRALNGMRPEEAADNILNMFSRTRNNEELMQLVKKTKLI